MPPKNKQPPHSPENEEVVIASCLIDEDGGVYDEVSQIVSASDFYTPRNLTIFTTIGKIVSDGVACCDISLENYLQKDGSLEDVGGLAAIYAIMGEPTGGGHAHAHASRTTRRAHRRAAPRGPYRPSPRRPA